MSTTIEIQSFEEYLPTVRELPVVRKYDRLLLPDFDNILKWLRCRVCENKGAL